MNMDFPSNPFVGQTQYLNNKYWVWDGSAWRVNNLVLSQKPTLLRVDGNDAASTDTSVGTTQEAESAIIEPLVEGYTENYIDCGVVGSSFTFVINSATIIRVQLTPSTPCTFTMPTAVAGKSFVVMLKQAASGVTTATFTNVKWNDLGTPTVTAIASRMDIFSFVSDGTNWYGAVSQGYTP